MISGNAGEDLLYGGDGSDAIAGGAGDDELYGGIGADLMDGGDGEDLYVADALDRIVEAAGGGNDCLFVGTDYVLAADAEIETIVVSASNTSVSGSDYANTIVTAGLDSIIYGRGGNDAVNGGAGADELYGGIGVDRLHGDEGNDTMTGGSGNDRFIFGRVTGRDVITNFQGGAGVGDVIEFRNMGFANFDDVRASAFQAMDDVHIALGGGDILMLLNVQLAMLSADDFLFI